MLQRCLTPIVVLVALVIGVSSHAEQRGLAVPPDYAELVPADAGVVVYIESFGALRDAWNDMLPKVPGVSEMKMPDLGADLGVDFPKNEPILAWFGGLDELLPTSKKSGIIRLAFRVPKGEKPSLDREDAKDSNLTMYKGMAILGGKFQGVGDPPPYTAPEKTGNPLLEQLPTGLISFAVRGSDLGDIARGIAPMASMAPMMMQQSLADRMKGVASKEDRKAIKKAQQGLMKDVSSLINGAISSMQDITLATGAVTFDGDAMISDLNFSIGGEVAEDHGVDPRILSQIPSGHPLYLALDAPTVTWVADFEMDVFEALFATNVASVAKFDALTADVKSMGRMITGGYVLSTSDLFDAHTLIGTEQPKKLIAAISKLFDAMNETDMGMTYTSTGKNAWDFKMDTSKMMRTLGVTPPPADASAKVPDAWSVTMTAGDQMVVVENRPVAKAAAEPADDGDVLAMLKALEKSRIIFGLSLDTMGVVKRTLATQGAEMPELPDAIRQMNTDLSLVVHSPDAKTVSIHQRMPMGVIIGLPALGRASN